MKPLHGPVPVNRYGTYVVFSFSAYVDWLWSVNHMT